MSPKRIIIVCEGKSERIYIQRLQSFINRQPSDLFEPPLTFISPPKYTAENGGFGCLQKLYKFAFKENKNSNIQVWVDFDLYHRNYARSATQYVNKSDKVPDFLFSFHNFEDFYALHHDGKQLEDWKVFGGATGCLATTRNSP